MNLPSLFMTSSLPRSTYDQRVEHHRYYLIFVLITNCKIYATSLCSEML